MRESFFIRRLKRTMNNRMFKDELRHFQFVTCFFFHQRFEKGKHGATYWTNISKHGRNHNFSPLEVQKKRYYVILLSTYAVLRSVGMNVFFFPSPLCVSQSLAQKPQSSSANVISIKQIFQLCLCPRERAGELSGQIGKQSDIQFTK